MAGEVAADLAGEVLVVVERMGRGPTSDMVPFSTLNSCGNSSRLQREKRALSLATPGAQRRERAGDRLR
jgi:hypothetical protein